jgi:beta-1,4-mannosyl-glycoprotein beta-1,4-N-acetylglucosaminyltransferase
VVEVKHLAAAPAPDVFRASFDNFDEDVWADAEAIAQACEAMSLEELRQMVGRAVQVRDLKRAAVATQAMPAAEPILRAQSYLTGQALLGRGRCAQAALALTRGHAGSEAPNVRYVLARIRALAGAGNLHEAHEVAQAARAQFPTQNLQGLPEALDTIHGLAPREPKMTVWAHYRPLAEAFVLLDLDKDARRLLERASRRLGLRLDGEDLLSWARLALCVLPPEVVAERLEQSPATPRGDDRWRVLDTAARALAEPPMPPGTGEAGPPEDRYLRLWRALAKERRGDIDGAIVQLCDMAEDGQTDVLVRAALARSIGRLVLDKVRPRFAPGRTGRMINLLPFYNELSMLRLHLEEMAPWVDRFVIVEAAQTFTGMDKPLVFEANRHLFADFADKIVHVPVREFPPHLTTAWARDFYQRDMGIAGASELCGEDDYILETDVDEIIDRRAIEGVEADFVALDLNLARFFLNYRPAPGNPERTVLKSTLFKAKHRARHGVSYCRFFLSQRYRSAHVVREAGWHFTSMFDAPGISLKARSYAHQEHDKAKFRSIPFFQAIRDRLRAGELDPNWERVELDDRFPSSLHRHLDDFAEVIL